MEDAPRHPHQNTDRQQADAPHRSRFPSQAPGRFYSDKKRILKTVPISFGLTCELSLPLLVVRSVETHSCWEALLGERPGTCPRRFPAPGAPVPGVSGSRGTCPMGFRLPDLLLVTESYLTLCGPTDCSTLSFPVPHRLPELAQAHCPLSDAIQPSHPLSPLPPADPEEEASQAGRRETRGQPDEGKLRPSPEGALRPALPHTCTEAEFRRFVALLGSRLTSHLGQNRL